MNKIKFSILITTKNRLEDLKITLQKIAGIIDRDDVEVLLYDDASTDGTFQFIKEDYPDFQIYRNEESKGLIHNRNVLLNSCSGIYAISLDDDAHFLTQNPLEIITDYFIKNPNCGLIACRIFWGKENPLTIQHHEKNEKVSGFVGCGHVWNLKAWKEIPNYPEWFVFYGEEEFASCHLFKKNIEIHYVPELLVHHRVDVKNRKILSDYQQRLRRSFRSGWYLFFIFVPVRFIPKKLAYSFWIQFKTKMIKGDWKATFAILQAISDVVINFPKIIKARKSLTKKEYQSFMKLTPAKIYWNPKNEK